MKKLIFSLLILSSLSAYAVDWSQPQIACLEDLMPKGANCLDLSTVKNPFTDFPANITADEKKLWTTDKVLDLAVCRSQEVLKRQVDGTQNFTPSQIELAWMRVNGTEEKESKLSSIYQAALENNMPPNILFGALTQESLLANLSITPDGDNYSCGMAQINIAEFCRGINSLPLEERKSLGWPVISCDEETLPTTIVKPLYLVATKNNAKPDYQLTVADYAKVTFEDVKASIPDPIKFQAVQAFTRLCLDIRLSIKFKAKELNRLYKMVPEGLRKIEQYQEGESFNLTCAQPYKASTYPLQTAWLLAVAMYNAGPNEIKLLQHYNQMTKETSADGSAWKDFTPKDLIEGLHWGGKWKDGTTSVFYKDFQGKEYSQRWYKSCVVQRHVARVVQHVTAKGTSIVKSIEQEPCAPNVIPAYRQQSSGLKN
ncbi:MAG: hypothetical protein ACOYL6_13990 [Bacteriovoracaceae bacterium]